VVINLAGTPPPETVPTSGGTQGEQPIDRLLFQSDASDLESLDRGRFPAYAAAVDLIRSAPVLGTGMGTLVDVTYAYDRSRAFTLGKLPGVDNAYLTVGLKSGLVGMAIFGALMLAPVVAMVRRGGSHRAWLMPAWLGILVLSMTQSFATSLYGPFVVALLLAIPSIRYPFRGMVHSPALDRDDARSAQASEA
jgi:O-antigen ligase